MKMTKATSRSISIFYTIFVLSSQMLRTNSFQWRIYYVFSKFLCVHLHLYDTSPEIFIIFKPAFYLYVSSEVFFTWFFSRCAQLIFARASNDISLRFKPVRARDRQKDKYQYEISTFYFLMHQKDEDVCSRLVCLCF
jgi:hypothetical protein